MTNIIKEFLDLKECDDIGSCNLSAELKKRISSLSCELI